MCFGYLPSPGHPERPTTEMMSSDERVDRRILWLTVSNAADRSSRMRTDDLELVLPIRKASVTESSTVSVEWPLLKPDCLASTLLFCERNNETWLKTIRSSVLAMNGMKETGLCFSIREVFDVGFLSSGVTRACLNAVGKMPVRIDVLITWRSCEGIGSRGHVVGWLEWRSLDTSASVGTEGEDGSLSSGSSWLEFLCESRWKLLLFLQTKLKQSVVKVISCYRSGGRWCRGTEERIKCSEEITHIWSTVDLM